eukprot:403355520
MENTAQLQNQETNQQLQSMNLNYLHLQNNVKAYYILQNQQPSANNLKDITQLIVSSDDSKLWLSPESEKSPYQILIDLSQSVEKPQSYRYIGIYCWHSYTSNPSQIKVNVSLDGKNFVQWQTLYPELKSGPQIFQFKHKIGAKEVNFIRLDIMKNHSCVTSNERGSSRVYLNQVMLFENYTQPQFNNNFGAQYQVGQTLQSNQDGLSDDFKVANQKGFTKQYFDPNSIQGRTIETQIDLDNPISYQNSVDSSSIQMQNQREINNPYQLRIVHMLNQLDQLQQQSFDQFTMIKQLKQMIEQKPQTSQNQDFLSFFTGLQNAYQQVQQQMLALQERIGAMQNSIQYSKSQFHNQGQSTLYLNGNHESQEQHRQVFSEKTSHNLNGTSTFRNNKGHSGVTSIPEKEELIQICLEDQDSNHNKENVQLVSNQKNPKKFEKSLERRIDKFISSQQKQKGLHIALQPTNIDLYNPTIDSQLPSSRSNQQNDIQKIASDLQQKLAIKAKKLQELQDREESKITMSESRDLESCSDDEDSNNSSVISNCSSLLKNNGHVKYNANAHRVKGVGMTSQPIQDLSKVFQYGKQNLYDEEEEEEDQRDSKLEQYFISSNRDSL